MTRPFDYFVIFAEMRTGSNFLESNLDQFPGLKTFGEAFNPYFMVRPKMKELFGVTVEMRNSDPILLVNRMQEHSAGMPGFRFFHDHDERVFEHVMEDRRCAKVVLTRNLVDAYVSRKIAWETDQWQLNDVHDVIKKKARFVPSEFEKLFYRMKDFQLKVLARLQRSGQTAFYLNYDDIQDIGVINGLARYLGEDTTIDSFSDKFKKQNPEALRDKVKNYDDLEATIAKIDLFDLGRIPNFEPRRPPVVPSYVTAANAPLLFLPIEGGPVSRVVDWLCAVDEASLEDLGAGMNQKDLRKWKRTHPGHRSFSVVTHPAARAHAVFCRQFLSDGADANPEVRQALRDHYDVPLPEDGVAGDDWDRVAHRTAFLGFLAFVKSNLEGQTSLRVDPAWATQGAVLQGFSQILSPDHILREAQLAEGLARLAEDAGIADAPKATGGDADTPFTLADIWDDDVEAAVRATYQRDYMLFGFKPWNKEARR